MRLDELVRGLSEHVPVELTMAGDASGDILIDDVEHDSRRATPGSVFCAVPGESFDGHDYVTRAVEAGSVAVIAERRLDVEVAQLIVPVVRQAMPHAASLVHGNPSVSIDVVGITGTNGKTTTTQLLGAIAADAGRPTVIVGTLEGTHTTPESTEWQRLLAAAVADQTELVAAEVSSHALAQHRVDSTQFAVAAFSNLSPDHLDYHGSMEQYFEAKVALFDGRARHELINVDDEWGQRLHALRPDAQPVSLNSIDDIDVTLRSSSFRWRGQQITLALPGLMNIANGLMAAEAAAAIGIDETAVAAGLASVRGVRGRMEVVDAPAHLPTVVVDYSHTPDSIERALRTLRAIDAGAEITIVFGCGGDRDRTKRPLMGAAAEQHADRVVVTSDNPRSEDPDRIIAEAVAGMVRPGEATVEPDRRAAISHAIVTAADGGVILIAGKGHEETQTIGDQVLAFDDVSVAADILGELA